MPNDSMGQDDIDKLLAEALGGAESSAAAGGPQNQNEIDALFANLQGTDVPDLPQDSAPVASAAEDNSPQGQDDIDALLAQMSGGGEPAPVPAPPPAPSPKPAAKPAAKPASTPAAPATPAVDNSPQGQDDIDALLADLGASGSGRASAPVPADNTPQGQDDIDALLADMSGGGKPAANTPQGQDDIDALLADFSGGAPKPAASAAPAPSGKTSAPQGQDDIDALLAGMGGGGSQPAADNTPQGQDDIDALLAGMGAAPSSPVAGKANAPQGQDDIDALLSGMGAAAPAASEEPAPQGQDDIDALLAGMGTGTAASPAPAISPASAANAASDDAMATLSDASAVNHIDADGFGGATFDADLDANAAQAPMGEDMLDSLLGGDESSPESQDEIENLLGHMNAPAEDSAVPDIGGDVLAGMNKPAAARPAKAAPVASAAPASRRAPVSAPQPAELGEADLKALQESLSLLGSAGEVEGLAGQIASLLGQLSERARRYQHAWMLSDRESKELRSRMSSDSHKIVVVEGERDALQNETNALRKRLSKSEGEKLAAEEGSRTEIGSLQVQIREQESRAHMLATEVKSLTDELERARHESTGADLESRRARFEADRLHGELEAERQERMRVQRALDNREKELQAMQARGAGQASTLFLDELHRLVRRLESELDVRSSAARTALDTFEKLEWKDGQEARVSILRESLSAAAGMSAQENDALKVLAREMGGRLERKEPESLGTLEQFDKTLLRYEFDDACRIGVDLMRGAVVTPAQLMDRIYKCQSLRSAEVAGKLPGLVALLKGVIDVQKAADRARGREGADAERLYAQLFDYLHAMVRMKLVTRATQDGWQFFLELRGRFSFLTSDKQWTEYRDRILGKQ